MSKRTFIELQSWNFTDTDVCFYPCKSMINSLVKGIYLLIVAGLLFGCSQADTLGGKAPDEIAISGTPTWENGIGELVRFKCASCHVIPFSSYSPHNTPTTLNLSVYDNSSNIRGANVLGIWVNAGILEKPLPGISRKMPLEYATPLTVGEIANLKSWAASGSPNN